MICLVQSNGSGVVAYRFLKFLCSEGFVSKSALCKVSATARQVAILQGHIILTLLVLQASACHSWVQAFQDNSRFNSKMRKNTAGKE